MKSIYHFPFIINKVIIGLSKQEELIEVKEKIDNLCKKIGYRHVKTCTDCCDISPQKLSQILKGEDEKFQKLSPKKTEKKIRKLLKKGFMEGVTCSHYANGGWFRKKTEGLILSQEYSINLSKNLSKFEKLMTFENSEQSFKLSLGVMGSYGYGNWDGREDKFFYEVYRLCTDKLRIPGDAVIKSVNLPQIMQRLKN